MVERRELLGWATGLAVLCSGCASFGENRHRVPDLVIYNDSDSEVDVSVTVVTDPGTTLLEETVSVPPKRERTFEDPIPNQTRAEVTIAVVGGPERSYPWSPEPLDSKGLLVEVSNERIAFSEGEN